MSGQPTAAATPSPGRRPDQRRRRFSLAAGVNPAARIRRVSTTLITPNIQLHERSTNFPFSDDISRSKSYPITTSSTRHTHEPPTTSSILYHPRATLNPSQYPSFQNSPIVDGSLTPSMAPQNCARPWAQTSAIEEIRQTPSGLRPWPLASKPTLSPLTNAAVRPLPPRAAPRRSRPSARTNQLN